MKKVALIILAGLACTSSILPAHAQTITIQSRVAEFFSEPTAVAPPGSSQTPTRSPTVTPTTSSPYTLTATPTPTFTPKKKPIKSPTPTATPTPSLTATPTAIPTGPAISQQTSGSTWLFAPAHYNQAVAYGPDGAIYFTEFAKRRIMKLSSKGLETILEGQPGLYGIAVDSKNRVFVGLDLSDKPDASGNFLGSVNRVDYDAAGKPFLKPIIKNIRRPRNLVFYGSSLYLILEAERVIISVNPDVPTPETGMPVVKEELRLNLPRTSANGLAVYNDRFYWATYGEYADREHVVGGAIQSANMREPRDIRTVASNLGRARGLGFDSKGTLYFTTESNIQDQGNSGVLGRVTPDGKVTTLIEGLDYPQFLAVYPDGTALIPSARENFIAMFNPNLVTNRLTSVIDGIDIVGVNIKPGAFSATDTTLQLEFTEIGKTLTFSLNLENTSGAKGGWVTVPFKALNLSPEQVSSYGTELPYPVQPDVPAPGFFRKPAIKCTVGVNVCAAKVLSRRTHVGWRWPMTGPEGAEQPPAGFSENADAFLINFLW